MRVTIPPVKQTRLRGKEKAEPRQPGQINSLCKGVTEW
jgi:hypothetical protein